MKCTNIATDMDLISQLANKSIICAFDSQSNNQLPIILMECSRQQRTT